MVKGIKEGRANSRAAATLVFGRNAIARFLGVKSKAMVTKSPAWQEMAAELGGTRKRGQSITRSKRIGQDIALERKSGAQGDTTQQAVLRREFVRLVRKKVPKKVGDAIIAGLENGQYSLERAYEILETYTAPLRNVDRP